MNDQNIHNNNLQERKIKVLDEHLINLIAAGEVIERTSSVVKELVENAIDAGASQIEISLEEAGLKEIVVSDNGCGMNEYDIKLAILPHATSKIKNDRDLFSIRTLGFRGEALASIIAVSNVKIKSCDGINRGIMLGLKGGQITSEAYIGHPQGTEIQVRNLFFNTPARLQNLKSENIELNYIVDYVCKIALANPRIAFKLSNNGAKQFQSFGNGNLLEVLNAVYDSNVAKNMITVADTNGIFKVSGLVSNLNVSRASKNNITIIVNKRVVRNYNICNAIIDAYKTLLTVGRYPICVLEILVDYSLVDVNVHPTKAEVRFSEEDKLIELITMSIKQALLRSDLVVNRDKNDEESKKPTYNIYEDIALDREDVESEVLEENNEDDSASAEDKLYSFEESEQAIFNEKEIEYDTIDEESITEEEIYEEEVIIEPKKEVYKQTEIDFINNDINDVFDKTNVGRLYYIGQLFGTYILAQNDEGFYMIDQHAANERVNYEKILSDLDNEKVVTYEIMFPVKLTFTPSEAILIHEKLATFEKLGIILEEFGGNTFIVRNVPVWMSKSNINEYVEEIITKVINNKKSS
ncbi:MAG: DNA mismatch repair endonuclease MutL, partial [Bacilli bacterium]|nr:DNA mismatch repair endonuclease MutL [Bacilli bacterium]